MMVSDNRFVLGDEDVDVINERRRKFGLKEFDGSQAVPQFAEGLSDIRTTIGDADVDAVNARRVRFGLREFEPRISDLRKELEASHGPKSDQP